MENRDLQGLVKCNALNGSPGHYSILAPPDSIKSCIMWCTFQPPTAPTSQNYTKRRDIMRQKLEEKKKKRKEHSEPKSGIFGFSASETFIALFSYVDLQSNLDKVDDQQTSLEEILAYIEGDGEENEQTVKLSKRQKKKQKKVFLAC